VAHLADVLTKNELPNDAMLSAYSLKRTADVSLRTAGVDIMNRSLLTDFLPVQAARTIGISALGNISWLRKLAMHGGLGSGLRQAFPKPSILMEKGRGAANQSQSNKAAQ